VQRARSAAWNVACSCRHFGFPKTSTNGNGATPIAPTPVSKILYFDSSTDLLSPQKRQASDALSLGLGGSIFDDQELYSVTSVLRTSSLLKRAVPSQRGRVGSVSV
jgi:hypothetical protein